MVAVVLDLLGATASRWGSGSAGRW